MLCQIILHFWRLIANPTHCLSVGQNCSGVGLLAAASSIPTLTWVQVQRGASRLEAKFQSDQERNLAVILEREAIKWFRPAKGQFQLFYQWNGKQSEYQPDFVAELDIKFG